MKQSLRFGFVGALLLLLAVVAFVGYMTDRVHSHGDEPRYPVAGAPAALTSLIARGEYLARAADCIACHTVPGGEPYSGGMAFKLPFGTIYATNITPDKNTGIGNWSDEQFLRAVRQGIGSHGNIYPAMPYTSYTAMSRDDVLAIKSYLFSLKPISQRVPDNVLTFPFNQRWGMAVWNLAFFKDKRFEVRADRDAMWNRGAYLATALGHCGECHTPRNLAFAMNTRKYLGGESIQGWFATNITSDRRTGIGSWSDEQLIRYLSRGHANNRSSASGPMAEVVQNSLQYLTDDDIHSLVEYLRSVAPVERDRSGEVNLRPEPAAKSTSVVPAVVEMQNVGSLERELVIGRDLFAGDCSGCHQWSGVGRQSEYATLVGSTAANDPQGRSVVQAILRGTHLKVGDRHETMPSFGSKYADAEVAALANFVLFHFGQKTGKVTRQQVADQRKQ
ncbi:cytochrome c [Burkholderia pseudomallei]|nr:cytochrome c [Burkholderia pseudomallei]